VNHDDPDNEKTSGNPHGSTANEPPVAPASVSPSSPIIGIGASAGEIEACEHFSRQLRAERRIAFVLAPHLDPGRAMPLMGILQRREEKSAT